MKKCAIVGHGPRRLPFGLNEADDRCTWLKQAITERIIWLIEDEVSYFITGMAIGSDIYAAESVIKLKARYPDVQLECAIPYEEQAARWSNAIRERYYYVASMCDKETMLQTQYTSDCIQRRNKYMIDKADIVLAIWDGKPQGTGSVVRYALSRGREVVVIDPYNAL